MKIICTVELEAPEDVRAKDIEGVVRQIRHLTNGNVPEWRPKVSVQLPAGVEGGDDQHA